MSKLYRLWYSFDMTYYDDIYEHAVDNHYLITSEEAAELGIPAIELVKLAQRGRLEHLARGLYRLARYVPSESDPYALAVAQVGKGAFLCGESVIALLGLAPTNPAYFCVATPKRVRKNLPESIHLTQASGTENLTLYEGIPSQKVKDALLACKNALMPERLRKAALRAREEGYLTKREFEEVERELS